MTSKYEQARAIVAACTTKDGVMASSDRYQGQFWTRDTVLAATQALGYNHPAIHAQLDHVIKRQKRNGKMPILYVTDTAAFVARKTLQMHAKGGKVPFMLRRYRESGEAGLANLTPSTRDTEILFIIAATEDSRSASAEHRARITAAVYKARDYVLGMTKTSGGFITGADWRDVRDDLDTKCVLTNACLLHRALENINDCNFNVDVHEQKISKAFWREDLGFFDDYRGANSFDILGNALAILYGIATEAQAMRIIAHVLTLEAACGFKLADTFLPPRSEEERLAMAWDKAVVWPWISSYMLLAINKYDNALARELLAKWDKKSEGFYEWYSIREGKGYGSTNQLWSAALYMKSVDEILK